MNYYATVEKEQATSVSDVRERSAWAPIAMRMLTTTHAMRSTVHPYATIHSQLSLVLCLLLL